MHDIRSWAVVLFVLFCFGAGTVYCQTLQLPSDYGIDLQLAETGRSRAMGGSSEITGTVPNEIGDDVFQHLVSAGFSLPYPWRLTLVNDGVINAASTAGGKIYVHGGMLPLLGQNKGLWAAVLSHETAHTGLRHQVQVYMREIYIAQMTQYYRARVVAGDKSANWALIGFAAGSRIALKKLERDQEHQADQQGMFLMARAGYHPDYVFALHHLLLMKTGEQSKFAAFFSDHPRWETRDQRDDKVYTDALAEFDRLWPDAASSPGGEAPIVVFMGQPAATENKSTETADITLPMYCRNSDQPVDLVLAFQKDGHPVKAASPDFADKEGNLAIHDKADCLGKNETTPITLHIPAGAVSKSDRKLKAEAFIGNAGEVIGGQKRLMCTSLKSRKTKIPRRTTSDCKEGEKMKKVLLCMLMLALLSGLALAACPTSPKCPVHDFGMYFTGQSKTLNGHFFELYHCPSGDEYWVRCD